jgi:hypothetical protein
MMNRTFVLALAVGGLLSAAAPRDATANAQYLTNAVITPVGAAQVFEENSGAIGQPSAASLFLPVFVQSAPGIVLQGDTGATARANAGIGTLRVFSEVGQSLQGGLTSFYTNRLQASSRAQFTLDDLLITPTAGAAAPFVNFTLRLALDGLMPDPTATGQVFDTATLNNNPNGNFGSANTELNLTARLRRTDGSFSGSALGRARILANTTNVGTGSSTFLTEGAFIGKQAALQGGFPFIAEFVFLGVPVGQLLELTLDLRSQAQVVAGFPVGGGLWVSGARVAFDQTVTFATDQVALLPAGFTLNSPSANIVNNVFTPVPLPPAMLLLGTALAALGRRRLTASFLRRQ